MYGAYIYDTAEMLSRTNERTNKAILGVGFINVPQSLTLMHVCMMHISMILKRVCMYGACIYDAYVHDAFMYDAYICDP